MYTKEQRENLKKKINEHRAKGMSINKACQLIGVNMGTYQWWIKKDRTGVGYEKRKYTKKARPISIPLEASLGESIGIQKNQCIAVIMNASMVRDLFQKALG